jgi:Amt family ammonium transporter
MVGGIIGSLLIGLFATGGVGQTAKGLFYGGGFAQLGKQCVGVVCVLFYSLIVSAILAKIVDLVIGFRVEEDDEVAGIDQVEHAETAYDFAGVGSAARTIGAGAATAATGQAPEAPETGISAKKVDV